MLLQRLVEYANRVGLPPSGFTKADVHWFVHIDYSGMPLVTASLEREDTSPKGKKKRRGEPKIVPTIRRSSDAAEMPALLADKPVYLFGERFIPEDPFAETYRQSFVRLIEECAIKTQIPELEAVRQFYANFFDQADIPPEIRPEDRVTFRVGETFPIELPEVQRFWADKFVKMRRLVDEEGRSVEQMCLVCGAVKPVLRRHFPVKGLPAKQPPVLVSINKEAFESYNLKEGYSAPMCLECSERAVQALNTLIESGDNHLTLGNLVYCFWTRTESEFTPISFLDDPDPDAVKSLLESVKTGKLSAPVSEPNFYAVALSPNSARVVVRSYLELTVPEVQRNLAQWFEWQRLMRDPVSGDTPLGVFRLAVSLYREAKDMPPRVPETLMRCAFTGAPLPNSLLQVAVQRNRAEQGVRYERAKLIKAVLASQDTQLKEALTMLNRELNDPAYKCGRLLAVIERIQGAALNNPNATLTDKYYGSASTAPASVFGVLLRMTQPHLSKLRKQREGVAIWLERELHNAMPDRFPATLSLKEQGLFALGYYHQRSEFFKPKSDATEEGNDDENA